MAGKSTDADKAASGGEMPEEMDLRSFDMAAERQAVLLRLFRDIRIEGDKIDCAPLKGPLCAMIDGVRKRYGLIGPGENISSIQAQSCCMPRPVTEVRINSDTIKNLITKGDEAQGVIKYMTV